MSKTAPPYPTSRPRVAIIGGGIVGLSLAWRLAASGCRVDVFERDRLGGGASSAAAGMLAAGVESEPSETALHRLAAYSQSLWPDFARELEAAAGMPIDLRREGTLRIALNRDDAEQLRFTSEYQQGLGVSREWRAPAEARRREPALSAQLAGAVFSPNDHQVDNRLVAQALARACRSVGVALHEEEPVLAVDSRDNAARGVILEDGVHEADVVVLAAGAWSGAIEGIAAPLRPPVRPVKGQMLALRMDNSEPLLRHVVWTPQVYMVPRIDGRLLVGATVEERGFDNQLTAGGVLSLLEGAWRALPGVEELPIQEAWVGHRPGSRDDAPLLGESGLPGLVLATGHHRNGVLLTPATAGLLAALIVDGQADERLAPFALARFATPPDVAAPAHA